MTVPQGVTDDAKLRSLSLSGLKLSSLSRGPFERDTYVYSAKDTEAARTTVTATPVHSDATLRVKIRGATDHDRRVDLRPGNNLIIVEVTRGRHRWNHYVPVFRKPRWNLRGVPGVVSIDLSWDKHPDHDDIKAYRINMVWEHSRFTSVAVPSASEVTVSGNRVSYTLANDGTEAGNYLWPDEEYTAFVVDCYKVVCVGGVTRPGQVVAPARTARA